MGLSEWMTGSSDASQAQDGWVQIRVSPRPHDGAQMHYLRAGKGPPLILLHGILGSAFGWRYNLSYLAGISTVYAVDLLGLGLSERVPGLDAGLDATADRVLAFMDAVHLDKADFIGTSHGGSIAMDIAARYPQRVGKLILAAPANPWARESDGLINFYRTSIGKWLAPQLPDVIPNLPHTLQELALGWMYGNPANVSSVALENYLTSLRVPFTASHILNIFDRWQQDMHCLNELLPSLRDKNILLIWGDRDRSVELASAYQLMEHLPHASLTVLTGSGHLANEEMPAEFNLAVREWLERPDVRNDGTRSGDTRSDGAPARDSIHLAAPLPRESAPSAVTPSAAAPGPAAPVPANSEPAAAEKSPPMHDPHSAGSIPGPRSRLTLAH